MGGIGSGRRYSSHERRTDVEVCPAVDLRILKPHLGKQMFVEQKIYRNNRLNSKLLIDPSNAEEGFLTIHFPFQKKVHAQKITLAEMPCHLGGSRAFMFCPECDDQFSILYLKDGAWACRRCHGLAYMSQRMNARKRHLHMLRKIEKKKLKGLPPDERPFRMRKKKHQAIIEDLGKHHREINKIAKQWQRDITEKYLSK